VLRTALQATTGGSAPLPRVGGALSGALERSIAGASARVNIARQRPRSCHASVASGMRLVYLTRSPSRALYDPDSMTSPKVIAYASLAVLLALYVVGAVSVPPGSLRHEVQTLPLWFPIVAGFQRRPLAKWAALPCFIFWLTIMIFIWLFLVGWARIVTGHFSPTEIAMTLVVGLGSIAGLLAAARWRTGVRPVTALGVFFLFGVLQFLAFRLSLIPYIARR
jgi:hypothetical protein